MRTATDAVTTQPHTPPDRISFTVAIETARDQVTTASGITPPDQITHTGAIGQAVLRNLLPAIRSRAKARSGKNPTSKYGPNAGQHSQTTLAYTIRAEVMIFEKGLTARSTRQRNSCPANQVAGQRGSTPARALWLRGQPRLVGSAVAGGSAVDGMSLSREGW